MPPKSITGQFFFGVVALTSVWTLLNAFYAFTHFDWLSACFAGPVIGLVALWLHDTKHHPRTAPKAKGPQGLPDWLA